MATPFAKRIAYNLRVIAERRKLSQTSIAESVGVGQATVSRWMREQDKIGPDRLDALAAALDVTIEDLTQELPKAERQRRKSTADGAGSSPRSRAGSTPFHPQEGGKQTEGLDGPADPVPPKRRQRAAS